MKPTEYLSQADPKLATIIEDLPPPEYESTEDVFTDLIYLMVEHQVPYRARGQWIKKVYAMLQDDVLTPELIFTLDEQEWIRNKLATRKYHNVTKLAEYWQQENMQNFDWSLSSDEEIREMLVKLDGVGEHSANMILLYTLQRPDIFLVDDSHIKQVVPLIYGIDPKSKLKKNMLEIAKKWTPHMSLASRYLVDYRAWLKRQ
jgi:DNA-3-methyladenine glycosylase II